MHRRPDHALDRGTRLAVPAAVAMMGWLSLVLWLDAGLVLQRVLGGLTWVVLALALLRASPIVRMQTLVVVAFATAVELTFAVGLEVYTYRLGNLPAYVPPGHGLVYLSAFALGHDPRVRRHLRTVLALALVALGAWALHGVAGPGRADALGAFWFLCLCGFVAWGPSREVYAGAAIVVTWLELLGTGLGNWTWGTEGPFGLVSIGNPPSGAAGGYGWFDLVALLTAPCLLRRWTRLRGAAALGPPVTRGGPRATEPVADAH